MTLQIVPMENAPALGNFLLIASLDGTDYQLTIRNNKRDGFWYMSLADLDGNEIRSGKKIVSNFSLLRLLVFAPRPLGEITPVDVRDRAFDPLLNDLGSNVEFGYLERQDIEAL